MGGCGKWMAARIFQNLNIYIKIYAYTESVCVKGNAKSGNDDYREKG